MPYKCFDPRIIYADPESKHDKNYQHRPHFEKIPDGTVKKERKDDEIQDHLRRKGTDEDGLKQKIEKYITRHDGKCGKRYGLYEYVVRISPFGEEEKMPGIDLVCRSMMIEVIPYHGSYLVEKTARQIDTVSGRQEKPCDEYRQDNCDMDEDTFA